jgi:uncharacterized protein
MVKRFLEAADLPEGRSKREFLWTPQELELNSAVAEFPADIDFLLTCTRRGLEIACRGIVYTTVEVQCVRCLEKFPVEIREEVEFLVRLTAGAPLSVKLWEEDIARVDPHSGKVDLSPRIRDEVILAVPQYPLCSPDCKGLCPICGANLNKTTCEHYQTQQPSRKEVDPRWDVLVQYLESQKNKK